ncbi:hypothetical protein ACHAWF_014076 [Thalassiosira exigua]
MDGAVRIGGSKGHAEETVHDPIFACMYRSFRWKMIPKCTGRYTCRDHEAVSSLTPSELLEAAGIDAFTVSQLRRYHVIFDRAKRKDPIYVIPFTNDDLTGLITYTKLHDEGGVRYVHTLNAPSGFQRKLDAIDVTLTDDLLVERGTDQPAEHNN